jgi:predicted PurR-regulated permease PerM
MIEGVFIRFIISVFLLIVFAEFHLLMTDWFVNKRSARMILYTSLLIMVSVALSLQILNEGGR